MKSTNWSQQLHRITHLSAEGNYTFIHYTDAPKWLVSVNLTTLLDNFPGFIRIHRKYAINPLLETAIEINGRKAQLVIQGERLAISRRLLKPVQQAIATPDYRQPQRESRAPESIPYPTVHAFRQHPGLEWC